MRCQQLRVCRSEPAFNVFSHRLIQLEVHCCTKAAFIVFYLSGNVMGLAGVGLCTTNSSAAESANSFPVICTWRGIQAKVIFVCVLYNSWMIFFLFHVAYYCKGALVPQYSRARNTLEAEASRGAAW